MGGHKSSIAPAQPLPRPTERAQYKRNGYILPGPCLQGRHPPPFLPRADHGQTLPLSVFSFQSNLQSMKEQNRTFGHGVGWLAAALPHPVSLSQPQSSGAAGTNVLAYSRTRTARAASQGKSYREGAVENTWPALHLGDTPGEIN